jgi:hypothetical protein
MKESIPYPRIEEEDGSCLKASEAAVAFAESEVQEIPEDMDYANVIDGILQVTPDLEEEFAEVERGETVSMGEFKTMFAKWL